MPFVLSVIMEIYIHQDFSPRKPIYLSFALWASLSNWQSHMSSGVTMSHCVSFLKCNLDTKYKCIPNQFTLINGHVTKQTKYYHSIIFKITPCTLQYYSIIAKFPLILRFMSLHSWGTLITICTYWYATLLELK